MLMFDHLGLVENIYSLRISNLAGALIQSDLQEQMGHIDS
jgi:hypothetical protein